jgi:hypothetical protein
MGVPQVNRVVATVSDVSETWYSRLVVLNADAPIPTVMASTGYTSPRWNPIPPTIAPLVNAWRIFNHAQDWDSARFHHSISIDTYDLVLSAQPGFKLSRTTLTTLPNVSSLAPVVSRNGTSVGYLYETGGLLRAYDLQLGTQLWSRNVNAGSPTTTNLYLFPLLLSNQVVLLDNQNGGGVARRWDLLGTRLADVNPLPSAPLSPARASVLDNDIILVPCADGTVRALTASGTSMGPFHTEAYLRDVIATGGHYLVSTGGTNPSLKCYKSVLFNGNAPAMLTRGLPTKLPIASPGDAGFPYVCAFSFGTGPTPLPPPDTRTLPLTPDPLMVCMLSGCGGFVSGHIGVLDAAGNAGVIVTPPAVLPAGLVFHTAYVVLDPAFRTGLRTISQAIPLTTM